MNLVSAPITVGRPSTRSPDEKIGILLDYGTWGKIDQTNWDFELEGAGQFGTVGSGNIGAGMFTAVLGYTFPIKEWSPRAYFEFDYASGDRKPGGGVGTFNQLFPNGHSYLGYIDYIGRLATYNFTRHLQGYAGYSFFSSGGFIEKTGRDKNSNFFYAALQYTF